MFQKPREKLQIMLFELDPEGKILKLSGNPSHFSVHPADVLTGQDWWSTFFPGKLQQEAEHVRQRISQGDLDTELLQAAGPDGSELLLELTTSNEYSPNGELEKIIGAAVDVTDYDHQLNRASHVKQEMDVIQQLARIGSWTWDLQQQTLHWSDVLYTIYGMDPKIHTLSPDQIGSMNHPDDRANVENSINSAIDTCSKVEFEHRIVRPDGSIRFLIERAEVITNPDGEPIRMVGTSQDITDHKQIEIASHARDELLSAAVANAPISLFVVDPNGTLLLSIGSILTDNTGFPKGIGHSIFDIFPDYSQFWKDVKRAQEGESFMTLIQIGSKSYEIRYEPLRDGHETISSILGVCLEITDRIEAEEKIIESERRFRAILESVQDYAIYMLGPDGTITSWNTGAQAIKGYTEAEAIGKNFAIFFPEEDRRDGKSKRLLKLAAENGKYEEEAWRVRKDGTRFWASVIITPIYDSFGNLIGFSKVVRDMTHRKMSEEQVQKQTDYIRLLQDIAVASNEAVRLDDALRFTLRRICDQTGWNVGHALILSKQNLGELVSSRTWYMNDPYQFDSFRTASESITFSAGSGIPGRVLIQNNPIWIDSIDQLPVSERRDAAVKSGLKTGIAFPIRVGRSVVGVIECYSKEVRQRDEQFIQVITQIGTQLGRVIEREQSEKALRQSEARFRTIFEGAALGIELIDLDGHILESNAAAAEMVGYTIQELRELSWKEIHHPANLIGNVDFFKDLQSGKRNSFRVERPYIRKDDRLCWSRISVSLMRDDHGSPQFAIGMLEDITEQRQMEAELVELQRSIMEGREAERIQLAQELHDGPVQDLYGIYFQQKSLNDLLEAHQKPSAADLQMMMTQVITKLRSICKDLRPPTLAPFGLEKAIRAHAEAFMEQNEVIIDLELMPDGQILPERIRLALFRIYQQTIVNVMRHAQATHVKVRFIFNEKEIILEVEDDGEGFIVPDKWIELARQGHMGLVGAAERAEAIGGKLSIESDPQRGTLVRVVAPRNYSGLKNISGG